MVAIYKMAKALYPLWEEEAALPKPMRGSCLPRPRLEHAGMAQDLKSTSSLPPPFLNELPS